MSTKKVQKNATNNNSTKAMNIRTFNPTTFTISDWMEDKENKQSQHIAFPRVNETVPVFELPEFKMTTYGVTPVDGKYTTSEDDQKRLNVKFPIDPEQKECMEINKFFKVIDDEMTTTHSGVYSKKHKKFKPNYVPIVKDPNATQGGDDDDDDDEDEEETKKVEPETKSKYPRHNYFRAKVDQDYKDKKIRTLLFFGDESELVDGKIQYKQVPFDHINDLAKLLRLGCRVKMIVSICKLWAQKAGSKKGVPPDAGLSLKIKQIRITGRKSGGFGSQMTEYAFSEDEIYGDEEAVDQTQAATNIEEQDVDATDVDANTGDDDDADNTGNEDDTNVDANEDTNDDNVDPSSEDDTPPPPKKSTKGGPKKGTKRN